MHSVFPAFLHRFTHHRSVPVLRNNRNSLYSAQDIRFQTSFRGVNELPQSCSICTHPERAAIEERLLRHVSVHRIAQQMGTSPWSLQRHKRHITTTLAKA